MMRMTRSSNMMKAMRAMRMMRIFKMRCSYFSPRGNFFLQRLPLMCTDSSVCACFPGVDGAGLYFGVGAELGKTKKTAGQYRGMGLKLRAAAKVECFHGSGQGRVRMLFFFEGAMIY